MDEFHSTAPESMRQQAPQAKWIEDIESPTLQGDVHPELTNELKRRAIYDNYEIGRAPKDYQSNMPMKDTLYHPEANPEVAI